MLSILSSAEEVRFELTVRVNRLLFSRQVQSTTLPLLRTQKNEYTQYNIFFHFCQSLHTLFDVLLYDYMKYLSIDYGTKKIGIATSDEEGRMAFPCMIIENNADTLKDIKELVRAMEIQEIVIGESVDQNGKPNEVMKEIRAFAVQLENYVDLPLHFEKEWMTSVEARRFQGKHIVDDSAAALILQRYLDRKNKPVASDDEYDDEDSNEDEY